jgi:hypothetical protein
VFYWPHQLEGPYDFSVMVDNLYPPPALPLFVAAAIMPWFLWWAIPAAVVLFVIAGYRPGPWAIAAMLVAMCWQKANIAWMYGSTDIWMMAGVAGGLRWGWPAAFVLLKPSLAPFALVGVRRPSWWIAAAVLAVVSLPMLPLWADYLTSMRNLRVDPAYSLHSIPLLLIPIIAWLGRTRT